MGIFLLRRKLLIQALLATIAVVSIKLLLHDILHFEPIEQSSLHTALVSSAIFVLGFLLSANIADFKESERIPAQVASTIDDMYHDVKQLHNNYPEFDLNLFRRSLLDIVSQFRSGTRAKRHSVRRDISDLQISFGQMDSAGVPPNFITKLKQQAALLSGSLFRINYIQRINFLPSAMMLAWLIVVIVTGILLLTNLPSFSGEILLTGSICFIISYVLLLIRTVSVPFQPEGSTRDDVSLFLIREVREYLAAETAHTQSTKRSL